MKGGAPFPIPGVAGEAVAVALRQLAAHCGERSLIISKERTAGGGYVYTLAVSNPPLRVVGNP